MSIHLYKKEIAYQLSKLFSLHEDVILPLLFNSKELGYHISLSLAKLKSHGINCIDNYNINLLQSNNIVKEWHLSEYKSKNEEIMYNIEVKVNQSLYIQEILRKIYNMGNKYGSMERAKEQKIIIEYSSPNIAKPFHAGHLRSTIIGNFIKQLYKFEGANTVSINYLGDWGKQYGLLALGFQKYGSRQELINKPIRHLYDVYVKINKDACISEEKKAKKQNRKANLNKNDDSDIDDEKLNAGKEIQDKAREYFKKMEEGDEESLKLWEEFKGLSIEEYKKIYGRLGIEFDVYTGESEQTESMKGAMEVMKEKGLIKNGDNGEQMIDLDEYKLGKALVKKKDGTTLYLTRDIGAALSRYEEYKFDKMIYVVASAQDHHFKQLFKILELMGREEVASRCQHVNFGLVQGMSTRNGTVVFLEDMLNMSQEVMLTKMKENVKGKLDEIEDVKEVSDKIGLSAIIVGDLSAKRQKDYKFNETRIMSFEGYTGPYLQYAHARLCNMMEKNANVEITDVINYDLLCENEVYKLVNHLDSFEGVIGLCLETLEPNTLVTYLMELASLISSCHQKLWIIGQEVEVSKARMLLFHSAKTVLCTGMKILGLTPITKM
ncbi:Arginyl-tRNA synthetase [Orpheovirus IHUMI-LCC2]|uniref:arginine--tRNA ligase n=1 Tax=Orpheovirus IHUMI-LCC2 TaxID=2023057 RepID=A0A2I2L3K1_9VIRU|nr:Arginyl-tRNA synthetase [Orpheovirus IHUMI-LCC2]SNW62116.1 Arginyl-tRNA synthetase [Orpheovirus IHUMI-LCC2]